jgi:hypothetical protein
LAAISAASCYAFATAKEKRVTSAAGNAKMRSCKRSGGRLALFRGAD